MKRGLVLVVALGSFLCSTASAFQGGGGESTKNKAILKKNSGTKSITITPRKLPAPPAGPKTPTVASLMVNSNLRDVTVTINGRTAGITDSNGTFVIGSMKPGAYTVAVTKPGYQRDKIVVYLSRGQSETLNFELKPITQSLTISSTPPDCEIYIDEILRGRTDASGTARVVDVPVGEHRVTIRKSRYREASFRLSLSSDKEGQIDANLELAIGFLTVATNTPGASIEVSGVGRIAGPASKIECQPGTHTVTVSSPLYITSRKEVSVSAGQEAQLSVTLEVDSGARDDLISAAQQAFSRKQYDRAITLANTLLSADSKHSKALTVLAESYFMKDDFNSFTTFGSQAIEAGGSLEFSLRHHHGFVASSMHPVRLVLTAQTISFDPQIPDYRGMGEVVNMKSCSYKVFTNGLQTLGTAEFSNGGPYRTKHSYLHIVFVDSNNPKKTATLNFYDPELDPENYNAVMVSRPRESGAMSAIAALLNRAKASMKARNESSMAANKAPEVTLDSGGSDPATGTTATLPTLESIVEANIKALGNPARWTTAILRGTYTYTWTENGNSLTGTFEEHLKGRTKFFHVYNHEKVGVFIEEGYDAGVGWSKVYKQKPSPMSAAALASVKRDLTMFTLADVKEFNEIYPGAKIKGKGKLGELEVYVVETNPPDGRLETLYFDSTTGLLMRKDVKYEVPGKRGVMVTTNIIYDGYVDVGGIKLPTGWRQITPTVIINVKISDTKIDVPIDDTKFKMPAK